MKNRGSILRNTSLDDLSERIEITYTDKIRDDYGNIIPDIEKVRCKVWARVQPYASKIYNGYSEQINEIDYRVTIRFRTDIKPTDIIKYRDKSLSIISSSYDVDSAKKWTILECKELVEDR